MLRSGSETLDEIEQALRDLQVEERRLQARLEEGNGERTKLLQQRLDAFKDLAQVRARHALADGVVDQADRLSVEVRGILQARQKTIKALRRRRDKAEKDRAKLLSAHEDLTTQIARHEARLDKLAEEARGQLARNAAYVSAVESRDGARAVYDKAGKKAEQAEQDAVAKGAPYEADRLFMYLWKRQYGRQSYLANGLVAWLDDKVAKLVGYHDARANYAVLNEIPLRLREHVGRLGEELRAAGGAVNKYEAEKIVELAGANLPKQLAAARELQRSQNNDLEMMAAEFTETVSQFNRYAEGRDPSFSKAIEISAAFLEQESLTKLKALARHTAEPSDDSIVERIHNLERKVEKLRAANEDLQKKLERAFDRKEELIRLSSDFRRNYYDDPGSIFLPGNDLEKLLGELLRGVITGAEYWARARARHGWRNRPADPYRRSSKTPPFGGGMDWPDFDFGSGSSSSSGADFRTGGGF